jgi:glycosyltransferase involved in cell wall biosynthesis
MFSICIPTYNRLADLKVCVASVVAAANLYNEKVQILIADNASDDGTRVWLNNLVFELDKIQIISWTNRENIGAVKNIKELATRATGDFIFFLTDDDILFPNAFIVLNEYTKYGNASFIKFANITYAVRSKKVFYYGLDQLLTDQGCHDNFLKIEEFSHVLSGCVLRKNFEIIEAIKLTDNVYPSIEICALSAGNCLFVPEPIVWHQWENKIYWDLDVDMSSSNEKQKHLDRDAQLALLHIPDDFFDARGVYLFFKSMIMRYGYIEGAIRKKFPIPKIIFLKIYFECVIRRAFKKNLYLLLLMAKRIIK